METPDDEGDRVYPVLVPDGTIPTITSICEEYQLGSQEDQRELGRDIELQGPFEPPVIYPAAP